MVGESPAYAETPPRTRRKQWNGVDWGWRVRNTFASETPPRTRRKLLSGTLWSLICGNTSAYAEKTFLGLYTRIFAKKHFRVRGENIY